MSHCRFKTLHFKLFLFLLLLTTGIFQLDVNAQVVYSEDGQRGLNVSSTKSGMPEGGGFILGLPTMFTGLPSTFVVPVTIEDVSPAQPLFAYQFNVIYDPNIIQPIGANAGCSTTGTIGMPVICNVSPVGTLRVSTFGFDSISGSGTILNLNFTTTVSAALGNVSSLAFDGDLFFDSDGNQIARVLQDGSVTITGPTSAPASVGGRVLTAGGGSVRGATVTVTDSEGNARAAVTNVFGYFNIEGLAAGRNYVVTTRAKGYDFNPVLLELTESVSTFNIFAEN